MQVSALVSGWNLSEWVLLISGIENLYRIGYYSVNPLNVFKLDSLMKSKTTSK